MTTTETLILWADERIEHMIRCPGMWGSTVEAVELQLLQLFELKFKLVFPEKDLENRRYVLVKYKEHLKGRFHSSNFLAWQLLEDFTDEFKSCMRDFHVELFQSEPNSSI